MKDDIFKIEQKQEHYYKCAREEMLEYVPKGIRKILDVGCGEGGFGRILKQARGAEVWGVEICVDAAENASAYLDRVIVQNIEDSDIEMPDEYFDCIIFNDVLEHFKYPWAVLKKMSRYLKENGYIVASIPNIRYLDNIKQLVRDKEWNYVDGGILDKTHLRFFTENSIKNMFAACGYEVVRLEGINAMEFYWKFKVFNWAMNRRFEDMKYQQFACVARRVVSNVQP